MFIRAPAVERVGEGVEVLAAIGPPDPADPAGPAHRIAVLCRQGNVLVAAFHPELSGDLRLHQHFLSRT